MKNSAVVIPAQAGIHTILPNARIVPMDPGLRRDEKNKIKSFFFFAVLALCAVVQSSSSLANVDAREVLPNPVLESRAEALYKNIRCIVCHSQSLDGSDSEMAAALRATIRAQLRAGNSDTDIKQFLRARYGDSILMQPPFESKTWLLWLTPLLFLILGGLIFNHSLRNRAP